ncbi:TPA: hypothetical protein SMP92_001665 [Pseudomonas putida]|nr:hypothetical protein [Pseudomonas putida]
MADFSVEIVPAPNGPMFEFKCMPSKQEGQPVSAFQGVGLIYRIADAFIRFDPSLKTKADEFVSRQLSAGGWPEQIAECFLAAPDWPSRMLTAWCLLGEDERQKAVELDYECYINYWPSQAFMEAEWTAEARLWIEAPVNMKYI